MVVRLRFWMTFLLLGAPSRATTRGETCHTLIQTAHTLTCTLAHSDRLHSFQLASCARNVLLRGRHTLRGTRVYPDGCAAKHESSDLERDSDPYPRCVPSPH